MITVINENEKMISETKLREYQLRCNEIEQYNNNLKEYKQQFEEEHKELIANIKTKKEELSNLKAELTTQALTEYEETQIKQLTGGLGIKVMKTLDYDKDEAFEWAKAHQLCLTLDTSAFKKIAEIQKLEFVTMGDKKTVTFPTKGIVFKDGE